MTSVITNFAVPSQAFAHTHATNNCQDTINDVVVEVPNNPVFYNCSGDYTGLNLQGVTGVVSGGWSGYVVINDDRGTKYFCSGDYMDLPYSPATITEVNVGAPC